MKDTTLVKERSQVTTKETSSVETEIGKIGAITISAFGAVIGLWSVACLVSAMIQAGGPLQLIGAWFGAVSGM